MDLLPVIESLRGKRPIFNSEADLKFALAWHIKLAYPTAELRIERPSVYKLRNYIDILVRYGGLSYPIELKYKTKELRATINGEEFTLKSHGAQDLGAYDYIKDIYRVKTYATSMTDYGQGFAGTVKIHAQLAAGNSLDCQPAASSLQSRTSG